MQIKKITFSQSRTFCIRKLRELGTFFKFIFRNFIDDDCSNVASTLTFTSLLAIVPLMSVSFALLAPFPVFRELSGPIQNYIFDHFVPTSGQVVHQYLMGFTNQVAKLSIWGIAFLFVTAVMVMVTIERAMNKIWKIRSPRYGTSAFLLYWAILSLTPVMLGLSVAASSYLISLPMLSNGIRVKVSILLQYSPFLISFVCFCFLYVVVPNTVVRIRHAVVGALVAAVLLETAKKGFAWYLSSYDTYELLYGAFATVPIFFLWVYWAWFIVLLGAEVAYALSAHYHRRIGKQIDALTHTIQWMGYLYQAQKAGKGLKLDDLINKDTLAYEVKPEEVIQNLLEAKFITITEQGDYVLNCDLSNLSFDELRTRLPWRLPKLELVSGATENQAYIDLIGQSQSNTKALFDTKVASLFKQD